jgi:hypothetical protein
LKRLHARGKPDPHDASQDLYVVAAFDFDILRKHHEGVHQWLFRRSNGFNIAANSISALALSFPAETSNQHSIEPHKSEREAWTDKA